MKLSKVSGRRALVKNRPIRPFVQGGIVAPMAAIERSLHGDVVAVGDIEDLEPGDEVVFAKFAGSSFEDLDNRALMAVIDKQDILGKVHRLGKRRPT